MPIYEYQCLSCGKRTELLQRFDDPPPAACPHCGGEVKKLISAPAVQFKGTGWYVTDYAKGNKGGGSKSSDSKGEGKSESGSESRSESKTESKSEAKSESKAESKSAASTGGD